MRLIELVQALEERGRADEARRHILVTARELGFRGIGLGRALAMEVGDVVAALEAPVELPGWDETSWGAGFEQQGHGQGS